MNLGGATAGIQRALAALATLGVPARAGLAPKRQAAETTRRVREAIAAAVADFGIAANQEQMVELERHADEHVAELSRLLGAGAMGDFEFVRAAARRHAAQRLPIEVTLQAYRCLQPMLTRWLQSVAVPPKSRKREQVEAALADLVSEYVGVAGIVLASEGVAHASVVAELEGDRRAELLRLLVGGYDESDARVTRLLKRAGYLEQRLRFCVALAQSIDPLEMESSARAQRIADAMTDCVATLPVRVLVGVRSNLVIAVFSDLRRVSGWTAPQAGLCERIHERLLFLGPSLLVGLSGDQASPALIARGMHEATVAIDFATVSQRVVAFSSLSIRRLLIHRGVEYVQSALPAWFAGLRDADAKSRGELAKTLRALADADMNVQGAARGLRVHANTVYARLQRVEDLTGLDAQRYHDLTHLLLAMDCGRL
jgi:hypothetical protein